MFFSRSPALDGWRVEFPTSPDEIFYFIALGGLFPFFAAVYQAPDPPGDANGRIC